MIIEKKDLTIQAPLHEKAKCFSENENIIYSILEIK